MVVPGRPYVLLQFSSLVCPETIVFGAGLYFAGIYFFSHENDEISEVCRPIAAKFCTWWETHSIQ